VKRVFIVLAVAAGLVAGTLLVVFWAFHDESRPQVKVVFGQTLGEKAQQSYNSLEANAHDQQAGDVHVALENEAPPGSPLFQDPEAQAKALLRAQEEAEKGTSGPDEIEDPQTLAEPEQRGCRSGPWVVNKSSRNGTRPAELIAHLTVSRNISGWGDVNAIVAWFNNPRSQASSNYVIDGEGNCAYIVNEAYKAWTQGFFNPWSISIEFIHYSTTDAKEAWPEKQIRKGALVFAGASKRWGIPLKLVNPDGCNVVAGITDHDRLECGNSHVDVGPRFPMTRFVSLTRYYTWPTCTVRHVKRRLNEQMHLKQPLAVTSTFTARAKRVLTRYQSNHGLTADGIVRNPTGWKLRLQGCNGSIR
jgi:N-acetyl-anhydromuramyl-L-alanine amidase AmpD